MITRAGIELMERGILPDRLIRAGIRRLLAARLKDLRKSHAANETPKKSTLASYGSGPIAVETEQANEQHYEVPAEFFETMLGARLKYSSCYWNENAETLDKAEECMLGISCERAELKDGMSILDLGCGWGSLSLWIAEKYPRCDVLAVSNSRSQREFIEARARSRKLSNLQVRTCDINSFDPENQFDRIMSVEMFEHLRNHNELFRRISDWLKDDGKLFVHIFCHRDYSYPFETDGDDNWMGKYFFTGGIMPSRVMLQRCQSSLQLRKSWDVNGTHYQKTLLAWLAKLDANRDKIRRLFQSSYGRREANRWVQRWRVFLLACAELFGYRNGEEWFVAHYLFEQTSTKTAEASAPS